MSKYESHTASYAEERIVALDTMRQWAKEIANGDFSEDEIYDKLYACFDDAMDMGLSRGLETGQHHAVKALLNNGYKFDDALRILGVSEQVYRDVEASIQRSVRSSSAVKPMKLD